MKQVKGGMKSAANILKASQVIGQRYVILRQLREEPWGGVYLAQDRLLKVEVGLKFIGRGAPEFDTAREIFVREAATAYRLRHPLILAMFHGAEDNEGFYLVQEPYAGESLLARLNRLERFTLSQALHVLDQVGRALAFAHEQGVVHQGLNPLHVLLESDKVKVANFACPFLVEDQVGFLELKAYAPPEVIRGEEVTFRANVFSLGVLGFRLTAGSLPYPLTFDEPFPYRLETPLADLEEIPRPLQNFLMGCLALEPGDRYTDIAVCLAALDRCRELWRATPREKKFHWQPKPGVSLGDSAQAAAARLWQEAQKLWQKGKTQAAELAEQLKPVAARAVEKIKEAPPRLRWGVGLGLVAVLLIWIGAQAFKGEAPSPRPETALEAPSPPVSAGPPKTGVARRPPAAPGAPATRPGPPSRPSAAAPLTPETGERYLVLVASYYQQKQAQALINRLKAHNIEAAAVRTTPGGKTVYQVRVGPLAGQKEADQVARRIQEHEGITPKVIRVSPAPAAPSTSLRRRP
jgi:cell division septation protein DedD